MILTAWDKDGMLGTIAERDGALAATTPSLQRLADSRMAAAGSPLGALESLDGWFNGYMLLTSQSGPVSLGGTPRKAAEPGGLS